MDDCRQSSLNPEHISRIVQSLTSSKRLWVAFSGGLDSLVLLHLLISAFKNDDSYQIGALHIHHGISAKADTWVIHCEEICTNLAVPIKIIWVNGNVYGGRSPEEVAREARYKAFEEFLQPNECLVLAHHEMDQAETVLLRLFRGSGPLGLGGMLNKLKIGSGELIRPLLHVPKEELIEYASFNRLSWIEDESNDNVRFDRNFLRHEIIPALKERWPKVIPSIVRSADLCLDTALFLQELAIKDHEIVKESDGSLSVAQLLHLETLRRREVIRWWLHKNGFHVPSRDHMERIDREILKAKPGAKPRLKIGGYELFREKNSLKVRPFSVTD